MELLDEVIASELPGSGKVDQRIPPVQQAAARP